MQVTHANLKTLYTAFNAAFKQGLGEAQSQYASLCTTVPSSTGSEEYAWLGQMPGLREWLGERVIHAVGTHGYTIRNKNFELTVSLPRTAVEDDQYGVYTPLMAEMGRAAATQPDQLVFGLLKAGRTSACYDGQPFFSTAHKVLNDKGKEVAVSNLSDDAGAGPSWYLLDTRRTLKPLIYQNRKDAQFIALTDDKDETVFQRGEFLYGVDARRNAGFGFWQLAHASNKALTPENLKAAITAMETQTGDHGRPLGISPSVLVVPKALRFTAQRLLGAELVSEAGVQVSNDLAGTLDLLVAHWL